MLHDQIAQRSARLSGAEPLLQEIVERRGHVAIFLPKLHCELNVVEYFCRVLKRYPREYCDYTFDGLRKTVPEALGLVSWAKLRP